MDKNGAKWGEMGNSEKFPKTTFSEIWKKCVKLVEMGNNRRKMGQLGQIPHFVQSHFSHLFTASPPFPNVPLGRKRKILSSRNWSIPRLARCLGPQSARHDRLLGPRSEGAEARQQTVRHHPHGPEGHRPAVAVAATLKERDVVREPGPRLRSHGAPAWPREGPGAATAMTGDVLIHQGAGVGGEGDPADPPRVWWCLGRRQHNMQHAQITRVREWPVKSRKRP